MNHEYNNILIYFYYIASCIHDGQRFQDTQKIFIYALIVLLKLHKSSAGKWNYVGLFLVNRKHCNEDEMYVSSGLV